MSYHCILLILKMPAHFKTTVQSSKLNALSRAFTGLGASKKFPDYSCHSSKIVCYLIKMMKENYFTMPTKIWVFVSILYLHTLIWYDYFPEKQNTWHVLSSTE